MGWLREDVSDRRQHFHWLGLGHGSDARRSPSRAAVAAVGRRRPLRQTSPRRLRCRHVIWRRGASGASGVVGASGCRSSEGRGLFGDGVGLRVRGCMLSALEVAVPGGRVLPRHRRHRCRRRQHQVS